MSELKPCPFCGAPLDGDKCPYCGTTFYDFSSIEDGKLCYMRIRTGQTVYKGKNVDTLITLKAIPHIGSMTLTTGYETHIGKCGESLWSAASEQNVNLDVNFKAVANDDNALFTIEMAQ